MAHLSGRYIHVFQCIWHFVGYIHPHFRMVKSCQTMIEPHCWWLSLGVWWSIDLHCSWGFLIISHMNTSIFDGLNYAECQFLNLLQSWSHLRPLLVSRLPGPVHLPLRPLLGQVEFCNRFRKRKGSNNYHFSRIFTSILFWGFGLLKVLQFESIWYAQIDGQIAGSMDG